MKMHEEKSNGKNCNKALEEGKVAEAYLIQGKFASFKRKKL